MQIYTTPHSHCTGCFRVYLHFIASLQAYHFVINNLQQPVFSCRNFLDVSIISNVKQQLFLPHGLLLWISMHSGYFIRKGCWPFLKPLHPTASENQASQFSLCLKRVLRLHDQQSWNSMLHQAPSIRPILAWKPIPTELQVAVIWQPRTGEIQLSDRQPTGHFPVLCFGMQATEKHSQPSVFGPFSATQVENPASSEAHSDKISACRLSNSSLQMPLTGAGAVSLIHLGLWPYSWCSLPNAKPPLTSTPDHPAGEKLLPG